MSRRPGPPGHVGSVSLARREACRSDPVRPRAPVRGRPGLGDLLLVIALLVGDDDAADGRLERDHAAVGRPGRVEVAARVLGQAGQLAAADVDREDVVAVAVVAAGVRDHVGARALAGVPVRGLVVVALLAQAGRAGPVRAHAEHLRAAGAARHERDLVAAGAPGRRAVDGRVVGQAGLDTAAGVDRVDLRVAVLGQRQGDRRAVGAHHAAEVQARLGRDPRQRPAVAHPQVRVALGVAGEDHLAARPDRRQHVERAVVGHRARRLAVHLDRVDVLGHRRVAVGPHERDARPEHARRLRVVLDDVVHEPVGGLERVVGRVAARQHRLVARAEVVEPELELARDLVREDHRLGADVLPALLLEVVGLDQRGRDRAPVHHLEAARDRGVLAQDVADAPVRRHRQAQQPETGPAELHVAVRGGVGVRDRGGLAGVERASEESSEEGGSEQRTLHGLATPLTVSG